MTTGIGLSADKITNFYLYGTDSRPANLLDPQILADREGATASVDVNAYMTEGPGRFASPAFFPVIEKFFVGNPPVPPKYDGDGNVAPYTEPEMAAFFGVREDIGLAEYNFADGSDDLAERVASPRPATVVRRRLLASDGVPAFSSMDLAPSGISPAWKGESDLLAAGALDDEAASVRSPELRVGVEKLDPVNRAVGGDVDVHFIGQMNGFHGRSLLTEAEVGDVVLRIVDQPHEQLLPRGSEELH